MKSSCLRGFTSSATLSTTTTKRSSRSATPSHCAHSGREESEAMSLRTCSSLFSGGGSGASGVFSTLAAAAAGWGGACGRRRYQTAAPASAAATATSAISGRLFSMAREHSHIREHFGAPFDAVQPPTARTIPAKANGTLATARNAALRSAGLRDSATSALAGTAYESQRARSLRSYLRSASDRSPERSEGSA